MLENTEFRKTKLSDIDAILRIINEAQIHLKNLNIDQWQNNYPNRQVIEEDVEMGNSYVLVKDKKVIATAAIIFGVEKTYNEIFLGQWLNDNAYCTIHRIAVDNKYKGKNIGSLLINAATQLSLNKGINSIRVDTHQDNITMQKFLKKNQFIYCGIIYIEDGSKRLAYEKLLKRCILKV